MPVIQNELMKLRFFFCSVICFLLSSTTGHAVDLKPVDLRCEFGVDPMGLDVSTPHFSWKLESATRGQRQTARRILVASSEALLAKEQGDLWDSGKTDSDEQVQIPYGGRPLQSSQQVFWKVRVWDKGEEESRWSGTARITMGLLRDADWQSKWIEAPTNHSTYLFRRGFAVKHGLRRAVMHICGLGEYELTVNGRKSGNDLFAPGWTQYDKTCLYDTHDLTALLRTGNNAIGIELAGGMYRVTGGRYVKFKGSFGPLKTIAQLRLEYTDGSAETIVTDENWRLAPGPITFSCVYGGEDYDARREPEGWNKAGFDDVSWSAAQVSSSPRGKLCGYSFAAPPTHTFEVIKPIAHHTLTNGAVVYDLGQNASIMPRISVRGPAGSSVRIIPAELLKEDGSVDRTSVSGGRPSWWQYTLQGKGKESWFPKFFYHGARYLQVELNAATNVDAFPKLESIEGVVVHSDSEPIGEIECSNELFNRTRKLIRWAQRSNMASVLTDCPHRERLGWLEQYHLNGPSLRYEFDLNRMFTKGMNDMADCQLGNGFVPNIAPEYTIFGKDRDDLSNAFRNSPEWGSAVVLVPWQQFQFTGDAGLLRQHYDTMKRYVEFLSNAASNDIVSFGLGDWYDIGPKPPGLAQLTPRALTATAFYYFDTSILSQTARLLGKADEAERFADKANAIRAAFNREFYDATNRSYSTGSQCANAIPVVMGLVPEEDREAVVEAIARDVQSHSNSITAGDVGYQYLLRALADNGRSDVIFEMNNQSERPGYGYQLKKGATSLTEAWDARRSSSQNHFMLGQIMEWFYHDLAGIGVDTDSPGFRNVLIQPQPVGNLTFARASYQSIRGTVESSWKRNGEHFTLEVLIPPNTTATVVVPGTHAQITDSAVRNSEHLAKMIRKEEERTVFAVASGRYVFESTIEE
jgi:hypothetical protein